MIMDNVTSMVLTSMAAAIKTVYPEMTIYTEKQTQNVAAEAVWIRVRRITPLATTFNGQWWALDTETQFEQAPNAGRKSARANEVAEKLNLALQNLQKVIDNNNVLQPRARHMESSVSLGTLTISAEYVVWAHYAEDSPKMGTISTEVT
ncbi:MAG: hypothetical protein LBQ80_04200 [Clostridium sp.]|jgi:hypothetical protein|nr:hypothetical protein [Clostridium sp.]